MGCRSSSKIREPNLEQTNFVFKVQIEDPSDGMPKEFCLSSDTNQMPIVEMMNTFGFAHKLSEVFDCNFVTVYDSESEKFKYFVHRLIGVAVENEEKPEEGKMWVLYLNNQKKDWNEICENDLTATHADSMMWKFEIFKNDEQEPPGIVEEFKNNTIQ